MWDGNTSGGIDDSCEVSETLLLCANPKAEVITYLVCIKYEIRPRCVIRSARGCMQISGGCLVLSAERLFKTYHS